MGTAVEAWIPHHGGTIYVEAEGSGRECLVMPVAWGMSHDFYQALLQPLHLPLRLGYFDPEGTGESGSLPPRWNPGHVLDEADTARLWMGAGGCIVLGHASGAFLSLAYTLDRLNDVAGLILVSPYASFARASSLAESNHRDGAAWQRMQERINAIDDVPLDPEDRFRAIFKEQRAFDLHQYDSHFLEMSRAADQAAFNPDMTDDEETDLLDELKHVRVPTLIVSGLDDPLVPVDEARAIAAEMPHSHLVELQGCGHYPFVEHPQAFTDSVRRFLAESWT